MRGYNFSNIIKCIETILAVVVILNFTLSFYAINQLNQNSLTSVSDKLTTDVDNLTGTLSGIHAMMLSEIGYDKDLDRLLVMKDEKTHIDKITIISRIKMLISNWSGELPYGVHYVIYYPGNGILIENSDSGKDYDLWRTLKSEVLSILDNMNYKNGWNVVKLAGEHYLVDIINNNGRYMLSYIKISEIIKSMESEFYGSDYYIAVSDNEGQVFLRQKEILKDKIVISGEKSGTINKNWLKQMLFIQKDINEDIKFIMVIHNYNSVLQAFKLQLIMALLMIAVVSFVLIILNFVNKTVLRPIQLFNKNIETLRQDEIYDVATYYQINELGNASKLMSDMVKRIKCLKIDIYEKTLEQQKTERDFLSLQIEPHFYLNCLNIIYNMAQMEQYKDIQRLSNCVSEYLRYIFKSRNNVATIEEELEHIKKYLEIQKIRYGNCFEAYISMDEKILASELPPLILQTFVENSVKYTINWEDEIELYLIGKEEKEDVIIVIEDNGDGYDNEILYKLQAGIDISDGQNRIGIMNAVSRLKLAFGNEATIRFYNRDQGGAGVEIRFPFRK